MYFSFYFQVDMECKGETPETLERLSDLNLSAEDLATYRRKFNTIDLNKDGKITLRELFTISRVFGYKFTVDELRVLIIFSFVILLSPEEILQLVPMRLTRSIALRPSN